MPIEVKIWNISNNKVENLTYSKIDSEKRLEDIIYRDISVLSEEYMIIGRQIKTDTQKEIDLLAINQEGNLTVIELKKHRTSRDVVAQCLDYASWVKNLSAIEIKEIFTEKNNGVEFADAFVKHFDIALPEKINDQHDMLIVCSELDYQTERIIDYLSETYSVPINAVFFRFFKDGENEFLSRSWLIDPRTIEKNLQASQKGNKGEKWNGNDYIVNIGFCDNGKSSWEFCKQYGFVSAGGGKWYASSLKKLQPGNRVFAMIPKSGFVAVGEVLEEAVPARDFLIEKDGKNIPIKDADLGCDRFTRDIENLNTCEYFVKVGWAKITDGNNRFWETGLRANQNSAFRLMNDYTIKKLIKHFNIEE